MEAADRRELGGAAQALLHNHLYRRLGFVRLADYARERLGVSARTVQSAAWVAARLDELSAVSSAFDRSEISWTQARALCAVASSADQVHWLALARSYSVEELERVARAAQKPNVPADPETPEGEIDGEPAVRIRIACPARVRALWRRALELASRMAGEPLADWRAAEIIAAEGSSGRPPGASIGERALLACMRLARRARHAKAVADEAIAAVAATAAADHAAAAAAQSIHAAGHWMAVTDNTAVGTQVHPDSLTATPADPFAVDARLVAAMKAIRTNEPRIGQLLRVMADHRFYRLLGFPSVDAYVRGRLGISTRKAWALLKVEKATRCSDDFARAYGEGTLSWARALAVLPVLDRENAPAWIARAQAVTVRRLCDEVNSVLEVRDAFGPDVSLDPPPLDGPPASPVAGVAQTARCRKMSLECEVQIGARGAAAADLERRALSEVCDVELRFIGPASVVALFRDVLDAFAPPGAPHWTALERLLVHVIAYWEGAPRHHDPIFARDGWRCAVPACSSRRNLHDHHLQYRSRGGDNQQANPRGSVRCASSTRDSSRQHSRVGNGAGRRSLGARGALARGTVAHVRRRSDM
ncbi:MAG: hypothetical protein HY271_08380 [Deltaproteobacteria bacterium]|nr:hypothetical protein [Deltaproteobacteria bacterium]